MKKGLTFFTTLAAVALGLAACNFGGKGGGGKTYEVTITNKEALAEIVEDDQTKSVSVTISDVITGDAYRSGDLVVTSDDESVLQIRGNNRILPVAAGETTVRATYKKKFSDSVDIKIVPQKALQVITDPQEGEEYILCMTPANGKKNYAVGGMDGYYLKSGIDMSKAAKVTVDIDENAETFKYSLKLTYTVNEEQVTKTIAGYTGGGHTNIGYYEDRTDSKPFEISWFKLNDDYSLSTMIGTTEYWIGTYSTYTTFSFRDSTQIQYKAQLFGMKDAIHSTQVVINEQEPTVKVGGIKQLTTTLTPENSTDSVTWSSDNKAVATVDMATGLVTGVAEGTAHITAQSWVNITDTVEVTVAGAVNYGTENEPLTVEQAKAVLDEDFSDGSMTPHEMYVTGTISSATYSEKYSNWTIWLYDGETAQGFELYATTAGTGVDTTKFVDGAVVKAHGLAKIHQPGANAVYELSNLGSTSNPEVYYVNYVPPALTAVAVSPKTADVDIAEGQAEKQFAVAPVPAAAAFDSTEVVWSVSPQGEGAVISASGLVTVSADALEPHQSKLFTITATYGEFSDTATLTVTNEPGVVKEWQKVTEAPADGSEYKLALDREDNATNPGYWYLKDAMDGYYVTTSADVDEGANVTVAAVEGGYTVKLNSKYLSITNSDSGVNVGLADDPVTLEFNDDLDIFGITVSGNFWGLGTRNDKTFTTAGRVDFTSYPSNYKVFLMEYKEVPAAPELEGIVVSPDEAAIDIAKDSLTKQFEVAPSPAGAVLGDITWDVTPSEAGVTVENGLVTVSDTAVEEGGEDKVFTIVAQCGDFEDTATLTVSHSVPGSVLSEVYKLDGTVTGGTNAYATESDIEQNGIAWKVTGNTTQNPWRIGGKSIEGVDRTVYSTAAVTSSDVEKVVVKLGGTINVSSLNSITLLVGSTQGGSDVSEIQITEGLSANAELEFVRPAGTSWANRYFQLNFNITVSGSDNKYVQLVSVTFFAY